MERKLRVLHIKNSLPYDGAAIIEYRLAEELKDEIAFDWFLISDDHGGYEEKFRELGSRIYHCGEFADKYKTKSPLGIFCRFLKEHDYGTVYFDTDFSGRSIWLLAARFVGVNRRIIHSHNSSTEGGINPILHKLFKALMLVSVTDYISCSRDAALWMFPKSKVDSAVFLKNGIDTEKFAFNKQRRDIIRESLGISDNCKVIGHVGRFSEQKNHQKLIGIFDEFQKLVPDSKLILIGDGELKDQIKEKVSSLQLDGKVIFVGNTDDVPSYLSAMDAFVFPSLFEGFGISIIEAECSGVHAYVSEVIPDEAIIAKNIRKIPLIHDNREWALQISNDLKLGNSNREEAYKIISDKGFDIKDAAQTLRGLLFRSGCGKG